MDKMLFGFPCIIADRFKRQNKTSRYKLINWFYKKLYGYYYDYAIPEGTDIIFFEGKLYFRDEETYQKLIDMLSRTPTDEELNEMYEAAKLKNWSF